MLRNIYALNYLTSQNKMHNLPITFVQVGVEPFAISKKRADQEVLFFPNTWDLSVTTRKLGNWRDLITECR